MSVHHRSTERLIEASIHALTPEMEHVCLLPSSTFVKITRIVHVVRSEIQVRAEEGPRCPEGSKDLHPEVDAGGEPGPARPARGPRPGEADAGCEPAPTPAAGGRKRAKPRSGGGGRKRAPAPADAVTRERAAPRRSRRSRCRCAD